jgi:hypothetical protein
MRGASRWRIVDCRHGSGASFIHDIPYDIFLKNHGSVIMKQFQKKVGSRQLVCNFLVRLRLFEHFAPNQDTLLLAYWYGTKNVVNEEWKWWTQLVINSKSQPSTITYNYCYQYSETHRDTSQQLQVMISVNVKNR